MEVKWTSKDLSDLVRLYEFFALVNKQAATKTVQWLTAAPITTLVKNPRLGEQLFEFNPREVRRLLVGQHEMRYEMQGDILYVLRLKRTRESQ
ncbi:type II toxin-antitoxin system RelE/ParE family toxin [Chromobacterium haemolyticum]|uniref:type II toxin-antitoxin system RelE/ParE family toxin n=1 Tax=Chromobacterium haemolyticum TaxID=394935 RepID=UPI0005B799E5|nr:type II toxin-antitoxin system RelE/ParE family toxin [Chromobacterium haemolyticum]